MKNLAHSASFEIIPIRMPHHKPGTKHLSRDLQLDQRKRGPLEIEGVNGLMDCGIECIDNGEGLISAR